MTAVETVLGPVDVTHLGPTLMHEHVVLVDPEMLENFGHFWGGSYWDEEQGVANAIAKLRDLTETGIRTLVDPTALGLGRSIARIRRINAEVDINIIVATGIYAFLELPNFFKYRSPEEIAAFFVREIRDGIDDTNVRPAFLKCAVEEYGLVGDVPRILSAVSIASIETGAPITVHTNSAARSGLLALAALEAEGIDPANVVIAHAGDSNDLDYLRAIADRGATLGCDRFGIEHFNALDKRIATLVALLAEGYADRIILSHDAASFYDFMTGDPKFADEKPDYTLVPRTVVPALLEAGVTQEQIDTMLIDNPRRYFASGGSSPRDG